MKDVVGCVVLVLLFTWVFAKACDADKEEAIRHRDRVNECLSRTCPVPMSATWDVISFDKHGHPGTYGCVCKIVPR